MFSQYSWWDFIKFVLVLAVPYYAFVLWKYYREDIREWLANRGRTSPSTAAQTTEDEDEEEEDSRDLYVVRAYSDKPGSTAEPKEEDTDPYDEPSPLPQRQTTTDTTSAIEDADISDGVIVDEESSNGFELALPATPIRPTERSLADVLNATRRMKADPHGALSSTDPNDAEAIELAGVINQQNGLGSLLSGVSFNR